MIATVWIADDIEYPKNKGVRSGYFPHHKFAEVNYLVGGRHTYQDDILHYPGERLLAHISFPSWECFKDMVKAGDFFKVLEVDRLIGYGMVEKIL